MMGMQECFPYTNGTDFQAIELPYTGDALSMVIFLPREGMFGDFEAHLSIERLEAILPQLCSERVALAMPKFELTSEFSLVDTLAKLGMPDAFTEAADFSGMDGTRDLFIGHVAHKAYVSIDEAGTEAAAATVVVVDWRCVSPSPISVIIDHPFIFLIRDSETGTILFIGRVLDPSEGAS
jgi:serpin B